MDSLKLDKYDVEKLRESRDILCIVEGYNFGFAAHRQQVKRLGTIIRKLEELIDYKAEHESR